MKLVVNAVFTKYSQIRTIIRCVKGLSKKTYSTYLIVIGNDVNLEVNLARNCCNALRKIGFCNKNVRFLTTLDHFKLIITHV